MCNSIKKGRCFDGKLYRIGELASIAHVSKRTIDYYTQLGLLNYQRNESNYRQYADDTLQRLKLIDLYKKEKLSLEEIRERFKAFDGESDSAAEVPDKVHDICENLRMLENHLLELKPLITKLNQEQVKILSKQMSLQCASLLHTLKIILGEN
jgi:DNA-binding transcriptional MerR regulator